MRDLVRRHPVAAFAVVFLTFGQAVAFGRLALARQGWPVGGTVVLGVVLVVMVFVPAFAVVRIAAGPAGLRAWRRDVVRFDIGWAWWLLPLVAWPVADLALSMTSPPGGGRAGPVLAAWATQFLLALAANFLTTNWWEEAVWTGVVQVALQRRYGPLRAVLLTAPLMTLQHLTLVLDPDQLGGLPALGVMFILVLLWRAFAGWVYERTRSLALVGLIHAATNATGYALVPAVVGVRNGAGLSMALAGLLALALTRGRLGVMARRAGPGGTGDHGQPGRPKPGPGVPPVRRAGRLPRRHRHPQRSPARTGRGGSAGGRSRRRQHHGHLSPGTTVRGRIAPRARRDARCVPSSWWSRCCWRRSAG